MLSSPKNSRVDGKVALVTGGGRGIGRSIALHLAEAGAAVAVAARSADELSEAVEAIQKKGGRAMPISVDVTNATAVKEMIEQVQGQLGDMDILINNAGAFGPIGPLWDIDPEDWWRALEVNVKGSFLCARAVLPRMVQRRAGCIINLGSSVAIRPTPYSTAYATSKAALVHLTGCLALETQEYGISVFAIHPGTVLTEMTKGIIETKAGQEWLPRTRKTFDEGRDMPPERAAEMVLYLASREADSLSGRFLLATDDIAELVRQAESG